MTDSLDELARHDARATAKAAPQIAGVIAPGPTDTLFTEFDSYHHQSMLL